MGAPVRRRHDTLTTNERIAERLEEVSDLLEDQGASRFRVEAYRRAARTLRALPTDLGTLVGRRGRGAVEALPGIGPALAGAILELLDTGSLGLLDRLLGAVAPEDLFASLPGIGPELARRVHQTLGVDTLEELEVAAWDGRLGSVPGFGQRRVEALKALLDSRLSRSRRRLIHQLALAVEGSGGRAAAPLTPPLADLLAVDAEYRERAEARTLPLISPKRFNPRGEAWLPVLHTERGPWAFHAFFSNTALAHRLGRTHDWVVIYFEKDGDQGQVTVVTERRGELEGLRVVRGQEDACRRHYREPDEA